MARPLALAALLLTLAAAAGCALDPQGACGEDADCGRGRVCTGGVCLGCDADADCRAWQACDRAARTCLPAAGRCDGAADCQAWEACGAGHACALAAGRCYSDADCAVGQACAAHACAP